MQSIINRKYPKKITKISFIQKIQKYLISKISFVISQKNLFVLKISNRIFLAGEEEEQEQEQGEEELSLPGLL